MSLYSGKEIFSTRFPKVTPFSKQKKIIFVVLSAEMGCYVGKKNWFEFCWLFRNLRMYESFPYPQDNVSIITGLRESNPVFRSYERLQTERGLAIGYARCSHTSFWNFPYLNFEQNQTGIEGRTLFNSPVHTYFRRICSQLHISGGPLLGTEPSTGCLSLIGMVDIMTVSFLLLNASFKWGRVRAYTDRGIEVSIIGVWQRPV